MDPVLQKFSQLEWHYIDDEDALDEVRRRLTLTARNEGLIPYSKLVEGIKFELSNVNRGRPFQIGIGGEWSDLHRAIVGEILGWLSFESYKRGKFLASALAVSKSTEKPSEGFGKLVKQVGLLPTGGKQNLVFFWSDLVQQAYDWFATRDW